MRRAGSFPSIIPPRAEKHSPNPKLDSVSTCGHGHTVAHFKRIVRLRKDGLLYVSDYKKGPQRSRWRVLVWKNPPKKFEIEAPASLRHSDICRLEVPSSARVFGLAGSLAVMTSACAALQLWSFFIVGHIKEAFAKLGDPERILKGICEAQRDIAKHGAFYVLGLSREEADPGGRAMENWKALPEDPGLRELCANTLRGSEVRFDFTRPFEGWETVTGNHILDRRESVEPLNSVLTAESVNREALVAKTRTRPAA
jgi:hypothetical protein